MQNKTASSLAGMSRYIDFPDAERALGRSAHRPAHISEILAFGQLIKKILFERMVVNAGLWTRMAYRFCRSFDRFGLDSFMWADPVRMLGGCKDGHKFRSFKSIQILLLFICKIKQKHEMRHFFVFLPVYLTCWCLNSFRWIDAQILVIFYSL